MDMSVFLHQCLVQTMQYASVLLQLHYNRFTAHWTLSGTRQVSQYQKGKTNLNLLEQEKVSASGISWTTCKSAPRPREITMPASYYSVFTGRLPFLPPNQQRQSIKGISISFH